MRGVVAGVVCVVLVALLAAVSGAQTGEVVAVPSAVADRLAELAPARGRGLSSGNRQAGVV